MLSKIKQLKDKLFCPLVSAIIQCCFLFILFFIFLEPKTQYANSISTGKIKARIESEINKCGKDTWISWIVLNDNKYKFENVIGCNNTKLKDCSFSVKDLKLNRFYNDDFHIIDKKTYEYIHTLENGVAGYFEDIEEARKYQTFDEIISAANKKIYSGGLSITRKKDNIIYVFVATNTTDKPICSKDHIVRMLENLSMFAKENL